MGRKAKFYGHCQICGKRHKLPGGVLSKHGYRVIWNAFWNICPGAGNAPFEESKDLIDKILVDVGNEIVSIASEIENVPNEDFVVLWGRRKKRFSHGYERVNKIVPIADLSFENGKVFWNDEEADIKYDGNVWSMNFDEVIDKLKAIRVRNLGNEIAERERYVRWQEDRIKDWEPKPLEPIEEEKAGPVVKYFPDRREGWGYAKRLKEAGHKVRSRRDANYGPGISVYDYGKEEVA